MKRRLVRVPLRGCQSPPRLVSAATPPPGLIPIARPSRRLADLGQSVDNIPLGRVARPSQPRALPLHRSLSLHQTYASRDVAAPTVTYPVAPFKPGRSLWHRRHSRNRFQVSSDRRRSRAPLNPRGAHACPFLMAEHWSYMGFRPRWRSVTLPGLPSERL